MQGYWVLCRLTWEKCHVFIAYCFHRETRTELVTYFDKMLLTMNSTHLRLLNAKLEKYKTFFFEWALNGIINLANDCSANKNCRRLSNISELLELCLLQCRVIKLVICFQFETQKLNSMKWFVLWFLYPTPLMTLLYATSRKTCDRPIFFVVPIDAKSLTKSI